MTEFSNLLKECRKTCGLTQYAIAKNMGIATVECFPVWHYLVKL